MTRPLHPSELLDHPQHLAEIPDLYRQLPAIDEPDRADQGEPNDDPRPAGGTYRAPINLTSWHLKDWRIKHGWHDHNPADSTTIDRFGVGPSLRWWVQAIANTMPATVARPDLPTGRDIPALAGWLTDVTTYVYAQPWAAVHVRDIAAIHARLTETVTGRKPWIPCCGQCARDGRRVTLHPQDDGSWYWCGHCGKTYMPGTLGNLGRQQPPMTGQEIAQQLDIPWSTVRRWNHAGLLAPVKRNRAGRKLYHLADALRVKERVRDRLTKRKRDTA